MGKGRTHPAAARRGRPCCQQACTSRSLLARRPDPLAPPACTDRHLRASQDCQMGRCKGFAHPAAAERVGTRRQQACTSVRLLARHPGPPAARPQPPACAGTRRSTTCLHISFVCECCQHQPYSEYMHHSHAGQILRQLVHSLHPLLAGRQAGKATSSACTAPHTAATQHAQAFTEGDPDASASKPWRPRAEEVTQSCAVVRC